MEEKPEYTDVETSDFDALADGDCGQVTEVIGDYLSGVSDDFRLGWQVTSFSRDLNEIHIKLPGGRIVRLTAEIFSTEADLFGA